MQSILVFEHKHNKICQNLRLQTILMLFTDLELQACKNFIALATGFVTDLDPAKAYLKYIFAFLYSLGVGIMFPIKVIGNIRRF